MSLQNSHQISDVKVMLVKGADGKGISNIEKTGSEGLTDIYTITYSDGTKSTFTVTNGASGGMSAEIYIISEEGSEVSVTSPSGRALIVEQVIGQPTLWRCLTTEFGVHTIESDLSGDISQVSLNVDTCKVYTVDDSHFHADITVTYPDGASCSCGKSGETPVYATDNPFTFTVHSAGEYIITVEAYGQTFTETVTLTTSGQEESVSLPVGSTVTPTDDVQTLLACAMIGDSEITTLAGLFADSTTLSAVIASHNAIDYLVRSTTFAKTQALVPTMTSDNTPSGECISSGAYGSDYNYKAFDGDSSTSSMFNSSDSGTGAGAYIGYTFPAGTKVSRAECMHGVNTNQQTTVNFKYQSKTINGEWTDISDSFDVVINDDYPTTSKILNGSGDDISYRLYKNSASRDTRLRVVEIQFYTEYGFADNQTAMNLIGLNNYASDKLIEDDTWCSAILLSDYVESVMNIKMPPVNMTGASTPAGNGTVYGSSVGTSSGSPYYYPWKAFDGLLTDMDGWENSPSNTVPVYLGYKLPSAKCIKGMTFRNVRSYGAKDFTVQGSNDSSESTGFTDIKSFVIAETTSKQAFPFGTNTTDYSNIRLYFTSLYNSPTNKYAHVTEIKFYGRENV